VLLACLVVPGIALFSFLPGRQKQILHTHGRFHSWGHLVCFLVVSYIAARTTKSLRGRLVMFLCSLVLGFGIEAGERLLFKTAMEWKDVLVDAAGVIAGTLLAIITAPPVDDL
jgi:hypothetical protein